MKITINYKNEKKEFFYGNEVKISDVIKQNGYDFAMPCGGVGKCGKCRIKADGCLNDITEAEKKLLDSENESGIRLACEATALGDCEITLFDVGQYSGTADFDFDWNINPITGDKNLIAGVVDIGTTTVAVYAYKMPECELLNSCVVKNPQISIGADVVSRLDYAAKNGSEFLSSLIKNEIAKAFDSFNLAPDFTVVTGNTAMLHFYKNVPSTNLAVFPFEMTDSFGVISETECIPKCISAFIGADITCGIISSGILNHEKAMLIDIGTNGEIVCKDGDNFICCSAAAGPAFEGANIKNGSPSVNGAINKVYNIGNRIEYTTIGNAKPCGICGSGLVDAVAVMLRLGIIDESGYLENDFYLSDSGICITPQDIRAVQTAKAAVRAAIETVCGNIENVEKFYIAGSFGKYLNIDNASQIGLLPKNIKNKTVCVGNTAAAGAAMMLFDKSDFFKAQKIAEKSVTLQLASDETFYRNYIKYMNF